jgi:hypothetical protein
VARRYIALTALALTVAGAFFLIGRLSADGESTDRVLDSSPSSVDPCSVLTRRSVAETVVDAELSPSAEFTRDKNVCFYTVRGRRLDAARRTGGDLLVVVLRAEADAWERYRRYWGGNTGGVSTNLDRVVREGGSGLNVELYADGLVTILIGRGDTSLARLLILARQAAPRLVVAAAAQR